MTNLQYGKRKLQQLELNTITINKIFTNQSEVTIKAKHASTIK